MVTLSCVFRSMRVLPAVAVAAALLVAALLVAALLAAAVPAGALAQGAGDEQYADPFGDMPPEQGGAGNPGGEREPTAQAPAEPAPAPAESDVAAGAGSGSEEPAGEAAGTTGEELPRTGLPAGVLALTGLGLLAMGALVHFSLLRLAPGSGYARAWRMQPLHQAPRPPGFAPLKAQRRFRRRR